MCEGHQKLKYSRYRCNPAFEGRNDPIPKY